MVLGRCLIHQLVVKVKSSRSSTFFYQPTRSLKGRAKMNRKGKTGAAASVMGTSMQTVDDNKYRQPLKKPAMKTIKVRNIKVEKDPLSSLEKERERAFSSNNSVKIKGGNLVIEEGNRNSKKADNETLDLLKELQFVYNSLRRSGSSSSRNSISNEINFKKAENLIKVPNNFISDLDISSDLKFDLDLENGVGNSNSKIIRNISKRENFMEEGEEQLQQFQQKGIESENESENENENEEDILFYENMIRNLNLSEEEEKGKEERQQEQEGSREYQDGDQRLIEIAIVGPPNAGKSVLLNRFVNEEVSAVSKKRHTTRENILGIRTIDETQIVFRDTPGYINIGQSKSFHRAMLKSADDAMQAVDQVLLVVDASRKLDSIHLEDIASIVKTIVRSSKEEFTTSEEQEDRISLVMNKVDQVNPKSKLLEIAPILIKLIKSAIKDELRSTKKDEEFKKIQNKKNKTADTVAVDDGVIEEEEENKSVIERKAEGKGEEGKYINKKQEHEEELNLRTFMISAKEDDGVEDILDDMLELAPEGEWMYGEDVGASDLDLSERLEQILKGHLFTLFHQEIPYNIQYKTRALELKPGSTNIFIVHEDIIVQTPQHRSIIMGTGGRTLAMIQRRVEERMNQLLASNFLKAKPNPKLKSSVDGTTTELLASVATAAEIGETGASNTIMNTINKKTSLSLSTSSNSTPTPNRSTAGHQNNFVQIELHLWCKTKHRNKA